jgi:nucleotide-binding universal stress UspA family protein
MSNGHMSGSSSSAAAFGRGNIEMYFRVGNAHDEIVWAADALNADLLVMRAEDCARVYEVSCVKRILRDARCPVLLVHKNDRELLD